MQIGCYSPKGNSTFHGVCLPYNKGFLDLSPSLHKHLHLIRPPRSTFKFLSEDGSLKKVSSVTECLVNLNIFLMNVLQRYRKKVTMVFYSRIEFETFISTASSLFDDNDYFQTPFLVSFQNFVDEFIVYETQLSLIIPRTMVLPPLDKLLDGKPVYSADKLAKLVQHACLKAKRSRLVIFFFLIWCLHICLVNMKYIKGKGFKIACGLILTVFFC